MPYEIALPDGRIVDVPDDIPPEQARHNIMREFPDLFPNRPQGGIAAIKGAYTASKAALETTGAEIARQAGGTNAANVLDQWAAENKQKSATQFEPTTQEDVDAAFNKSLLSGIGAWKAKNLTEPLGGMAGTYGPAMAAGLIPGIGPAVSLGALAGIEGGMNIERWKEQHKGQGMSSEDMAGAMAMGLIQGAIDRFGFGHMAHGLLGSHLAQNEAKRVAKDVLVGKLSADAAEKQLGSTLRNYLAATGSNAVLGTGMMATTEALRRGQAGQELASPDAIDEYLHGAQQAAILAPVMGIGGLGARGKAKQFLKQEEQRGINQRYDLGMEQTEVAQYLKEKEAAEQAAAAAAPQPVVKNAPPPDAPPPPGIDIRDPLSPGVPPEGIPERRQTLPENPFAANLQDLIRDRAVFAANETGTKAAEPPPAPTTDLSQPPQPPVADTAPPVDLQPPAPTGTITARTMFSAAVKEKSPTYRSGALDGKDLNNPDDVKALIATLTKYGRNVEDNPRNADQRRHLEATVQFLQGRLEGLSLKPEKRDVQTDQPAAVRDGGVPVTKADDGNLQVHGNKNVADLGTGEQAVGVRGEPVARVPGGLSTPERAGNAPAGRSAGTDLPREGHGDAPLNGTKDFAPGDYWAQKAEQALDEYLLAKKALYDQYQIDPNKFGAYAELMKTILPAQKEAFLKLKKEYQQANHNYIAGTEPPAEKPAVNTDPYQDPAYLEAKKAVFALHKELEAKYGTGKVPAEELALFNTLKDKATYALNVAMDKVGKPPAEKPVVNTDPYKDPTVVKLKAALDDAENALHKKFDDPYSDAAFQSPEYQTVEKANIAYLEALDAASNKLNIHQPMDKPAEHKSMEDAFDTLSPDDPIFKSNEAAPLTEKDPGYWFDKILALKAEIRAKHGLGEYADVTPYLTEPEQQQLAELKKQYNIALGNGAMLQDTPKPLMLDEWTNAAKPASAPKKKSLLDRWNEHNGDKEPEATPDDLHRWNDTELSRTVRSAIEDGDGKRALLAFAATTKNAGYRTIARALLKLDLRPSIEFFDHEGKHAGSFDSKQNHLTFDPNAVSERTFLHEWVHAATSWAWNHNSKLNATQKAAKKELDDIFDTLRNKYPELVNEYGLRHNTKEMIAEAFTNPRFQELLKDIQLERNARHSDRGMFRHLWDKFVHSLARFLHIDDKSALADILNTSVELFHNPAEPLPQTQTRAFKQWFGKSVVVDEHGNPKIWFHGTAQDIHSFRAKQAGAIFVTKSPRFAGNFADMSRDWMERNYKDVLTPDQIAAAEQDAIKAIHEHYAPTKWRDYKPDELKPFIDDAVWAVKHNPRSSDFMMEAVRNHMPSRENIIPLFVRAEKPFDFENPAHVDAMVKEYNRYNVPMRDTMIDDIRAGNWSTIERKDVQAAIRKLGFDGFYMGEAGEKNLAVYSQTQLKSATGNRGSFDRKNPDIDYATGDYIDSTTAEPKRGPTERMARAVTGLRGKNLGDAKTMGKYVWDAIQQGGFDHMWGATRFKPNQNATEIVNGKRRITWGAALQYMGYAPQLSAESIPRGGVAMNAEGMFHVVDNPQVNQRVLTEKVEALNAPPGVDKWRVANGLAVNARYAEIEANIKKANAFLPPNQQKPLPPRPAGVTDTTLRQFWQDYRTEPSVKEFLDVIKGINDQNILTLEQGQVISPETAKAWRQNKFYVPLQRIMDEDADLGHVHHYGGARTKEVKKFKGSERDVNDVYENLIRQRLWAVDAAMRNEASLRALKDLEGIPLAGTTRLPAQPHNMHNVVMVKEAGEKVYYKVDDPLAYRSFVGIADAFTSPFFRGMEAFTHLLRNMVMLSPDAIFRNMARDVMDAKLYGYLDKNIVQSTREITGQMAASLPHIVREARGGPQYHPRYGITQFGVTGKREYTSLEKEVDRVIREQMRGAPATDWAAWTDKAVGSVIHAWEHVALEAELATRNRVYEQTLARTGSEAEAAMAAINTIDFRRRGDWQAVTLAKKLIPFFNSSLQGFYKIVRAAQGDGMGANVGAHGAAKALALKGMQMMAVASLYNAAMADNEEYKAVKKEIRDNNILIPLPGDGMFMKIPLPFELGALFWSIPSNAIDTMFRDQTGREFLGALWSITKHQLPGAGVQVAKPTVEVLTNHDFFTGKPIESATQQQLAGHERYNDNTSEVAKALGGDTLSPLKVDKLINGYFGSIGAFAVGLADSLVNAVADAKPAKPLNKLPGIRSVVTDPLSSAHVDKFYELADMSHEVYATVKKLLAEGRAEEARTYLAKEGPTGVPNATLYGMNSSMQATARWLAEMRRREHQIATLPPEQMSPEMKRIQIEQMKRAVNDAMKKAMPSYRKASGE